MKALSLWQPWASAIAVGAKLIETRRWQTSYRGPILIHAAKHHCGKRDADIFEAISRTHLGLNYWDLPFGALIAVADLVDCWQIGSFVGVNQFCCSRGIMQISRQERALGDFTPGRYGWVLANVRALPQPIPYTGAQGLFDVPVTPGLQQQCEALREVQHGR